MLLTRDNISPCTESGAVMTKETADIKIEKLKMETKPYDKVLAKVAELCPGAVQNGKVNFERLKAELSDVVDENTHETYEFKWVGKNASIVEANKPIRKTLRPCKEESKNWDTTENLYIEGDNLEVLKLLQEGYLGKVKMIYIDPPYNTGNDFVYHDNRVQSEEEMNKGIDLFDEEDNRLLSKAFVRNKESNGRFHSDWCSMMYPRLKLARDLLSDDGVIFISIDDNEVANLKKICDEVFGEDNFRNQIIVRRGAKSVQAQFETWDKLGQEVEHILFYTKNPNYRFPKQTKKLDEKRQGSWNNHWRGTDRPTMRYELFGIIPTSGQWRWGKERSLNAIANYNKMLLDLGKTEETITPGDIDSYYLKQDEDFDLLRLSKNGKPEHYVSSADSTLLNTSWQDLLIGSSSEILDLFETKVFDTAKLTAVIKRMLGFGIKERHNIILDFFSGSATTAHAVMQLNAEDGGKRKFIMVQLPELTDEKSEAYKAGYKNICEIGKERIRRAGEKIKAEHPKATDLDIGFRVLKVADSNMRDVYYKPNELKQTDLLNSIDNIKSDRTPLDLLFGVMVEWGVSLSLPLKEIKVSNNTIHIVGDNDLVACFDKHIDTETITKMAELNPIRVIFRDSCFIKDYEKINMFEIFKTICHWDDKQAKNNIRVL